MVCRRFRTSLLNRKVMGTPNTHTRYSSEQKDEEMAKKCGLWAVLGRKPKLAESKGAAPDMSFYKGSTGFNMTSLGSFNDLESVDLLEPFRTLWENTRPMMLSVKSRAAWDQRRGYFKSLMYWYFLEDAAQRRETFRFPDTIRNTYIVKALRLLARPGPDVRRTDASRDVAGDIVATLRRLAEHEGQQREVEKRIREGEDVCEEDRAPARQDEHFEVRTRREKAAEIKKMIADLERKLQELPNETDSISSVAKLVTTSREKGCAKEQNTSSIGQTRNGGPQVGSQARQPNKRSRILVEDDSDVQAPPRKYATHARTETEPDDAFLDIDARDVVVSIESDVDKEDARAGRAEDLLQSFQKPEKRNKPDAIRPLRFVRLKTGPLAYDETRGYTPLLDLSNRDPEARVHPFNRPSSPGHAAHVTPPKTNTTMTVSMTTLPNSTVLILSDTQLISDMKEAIAKEEDLTAQLDDIEQEQRGLLRQWELLANQRQEVDDKLRRNRMAIAAIAKGLTGEPTLENREKVNEID